MVFLSLYKPTDFRNYEIKAFWLFIPCYISQSLGIKRSLQFHFFVQSIKKSVPCYDNLRLPLSNIITWSNRSNFNVIISEWTRLASELLPIKTDVHIVFKIVGLKLLEHRNNTCDFTVFILSFNAYKIFFLEIWIVGR